MCVGHRALRARSFLSLCAAALAAGCSGASMHPETMASADAIAPNTITCADWVHNSNGTWTVGPAPHPFDLGSAKNVMVTGWTVSPDGLHYGGYDLWAALNQKCASGG